MPSKRVAYVHVRRCVSCGACTKECPLSAISIWKGCHATVEESRCVGCGKCAEVCPVGCIEIREREAQA